MPLNPEGARLRLALLVLAGNVVVRATQLKRKIVGRTANLYAVERAMTESSNRNGREAIQVTPVSEVLERLRLDLVTELESKGFHVPDDAKQAGQAPQAVTAWLRLNHRSIDAKKRGVKLSVQLRERALEVSLQDDLARLLVEVESGADLTPRLSRRCYMSGFSDFLFNTFGIHHLHLGAPGQGVDATKQHLMAGGTSALVFVFVEDDTMHLLDVLDHSVFSSAELTKQLIRIVLSNWPHLLERYIFPDVIECDTSFEEAFRAAKQGFTTMFEVDGTFLGGDQVLDGVVRNGQRTPCTSAEVALASDEVLNAVANLVRLIQLRAPSLAASLVPSGAGKLERLDLSVVRFGDDVRIRDEITGTVFRSVQGCLAFARPVR